MKFTEINKSYPLHKLVLDASLQKTKLFVGLKQFLARIKQIAVIENYGGRVEVVAEKAFYEENKQDERNGDDFGAWNSGLTKSIPFSKFFWWAVAGEQK